MTDSPQDGAPALAPGARLGPYTILEQIGAGGMGAVYRAHDERLQRDVAVKVIKAPYANDAARRRRFETEARAAARLGHPGIVAIYDVGEADGTPYIVSEYVRGGTLASRLAKGALPPGEARETALAVAEALAEAHRHGVVHRDLKPENILLTANGTPKISDFGLSKLLEAERVIHPDDSTAVANLTTDGALLGTPAYMAPEQAAGSVVDFRCDQFAFAVVVLQMLSGKSPFRRASMAQTLAAILHEEPDLEGIERIAPPGMVAILRRCLEKDPRSRYASTDDLAHDLRQAMKERPAAVKPAGQTRRLVAAVLTAVVIIAVASAVVISRRRAAIRQPIASLAILPLQNFSAEPSQDYFADGLTEEITNQLASLRSLRVASRTSASAYRGTKKPLSEVARDLGVDGLIEGSLIRSGEEARVTIQLIDGRTDRHVWSHSFERHGANVLALQRDIAVKIADQIRVTLSPAERQRMSQLPTSNTAAYDAYLHATYKLKTGISQPPQAREGLKYAEQAIVLDPEFAEAYVAVARACQQLIFGAQAGKEYDERASVAIEKALSLDPSLPDAYLVRGNLQYNRWHGFNVGAAIVDYRHAVTLNPNAAEAHVSLGGELAHLGLHDESVTELRTSLRLDPDSEDARYRLGRPLWQSNRFREALDSYDRYGVNAFEKAATLAWLGRSDDAWRLVADEEARLAPENAKDPYAGYDIGSVRALLFAMAGKRNECEKEITRAAAAGRDKAHFHHAAFFLAAACAELGDEEKAVQWLQLAADTGMPNYPLFRDNPSMLKLHGKPRYESFMASLKLRWDQINAQIR